jgi:hypothetical protein
MEQDAREPRLHPLLSKWSLTTGPDICYKIIVQKERGLEKKYSLYRPLGGMRTPETEQNNTPNGKRILETRQYSF